MIAVLRSIFCLLLLGAWSISFSQSIKADASLLDKPDGAKVGSIKAGSSVTVVKRQGFWAQLQSANGAGWVKLTQLTFGGVSGVAALDTGRAGSGNIVSTSAARGLSSKDLLSGRPDSAAVAAMDAWTPELASVEKFVAEGGVTSVNLTFALRVPTAANTSRKNAPASSND